MTDQGRLKYDQVEVSLFVLIFMLILVAEMIEESLTNGLFYISSINVRRYSQLH